jgi:hypothetical protein
MKLFRRVTGWVSALLMGSAILAAQTPSQWDVPAEALAAQIAGSVGPGQISLNIRNLSSIADSSLPAIRSLLERDLKAHGISLAGGESANSVRVTLSQNAWQRLWVAEISEGNETRVVMTPFEAGPAPAKAVADYMTLRREKVPILMPSQPSLVPESPIVGGLEHQSSLVILRSNGLELLELGMGGYQQEQTFSFQDRRQFSRDARGMILPSADGTGFTAFVGQLECTGTFPAAAASPGHPEEKWNVACHASDEPWPILQSNEASARVAIKAFYNAARNYFTGVTTPSLGVDLPPFYASALLQRANGAAVLIGGIDGKVQVMDGGSPKAVSGTRDWGSDFAVLKSGCGSGAQVIASGSGEAAADSLRAYELPAQEAVPASAPLAMNGTVMALWAAPDGRSLLAAVRSASGDYEVDRVTSLCN